MTERWVGGLITKTPVIPVGGLLGAAPGMWTLGQVFPYLKSGNWPHTLVYGGLLAAATPATVTVAGGTQPMNIVVSPDSKFVYVIQESGSVVAQFSRNTANGTLTPLTPATVSCPGIASGALISPDGKFFYVLGYGAFVIQQFSRDTATGLLTAGGTISANTGGSSTREMCMSPDGLSLYFGGYSGGVYQMSRNPTTGALAALVPPSVASYSGVSGQSLVVSPDGAHVYSVSSSNTLIYQFSRNTSTGLLTALGTPTTALATNSKDIAISPDGLGVYVSSTSALTISQFGRDPATGLLTALSPATIPTGQTGATSFNICVSGDNLNLYSLNVNGALSTISQFSRNLTSSVLTLMTPATIASTNNGYGIAISPDLSTVYAGSQLVAALSVFTRA
jgi:6-phosphogluconolactonase (cycloisomerase 2 family)